MPKVAIIGAGYAGLAAAWHLLPKNQVTLFYKNGLSASDVSTGLLHPYPAEHAKKSWRADEGMQEALLLLQVAESFLQKPVFLPTGIFRPAPTRELQASFQHCASSYEDVEWWEADFASAKVSGLSHPGLFIKSGITVYSRRYLQGLRLACESRGADFVLQEIDSLASLGDFDQIVMAAGAGSLKFSLPEKPRLSLTKGQTLLCRWPIERPPLPFSISSKGHISPCSERGCCLIGSTYERHYTSLEPDLKEALLLKEKVAAYYPPARELEVLSCEAGFRIAQNGDYRPVLKRISATTCLFTALGSRGLLYHALLGKELAFFINNKI